jgi:hypothetical protein
MYIQNTLPQKKIEKEAAIKKNWEYVWSKTVRSVSY